MLSRGRFDDRKNHDKNGYVYGWILTLDRSRVDKSEALKNGERVFLMQRPFVGFVEMKYLDVKYRYVCANANFHEQNYAF